MSSEKKSSSKQKALQQGLAHAPLARFFLLGTGELLADDVGDVLLRRSLRARWLVGPSIGRMDLI